MYDRAGCVIAFYKFYHSYMYSVYSIRIFWSFFGGKGNKLYDNWNLTYI